MVRAVHSVGGKLALQVAHAGCKANPNLSSLEPVGPTAESKDGKPVCRAADKDEITVIIAAYARAASRAKEAGFDAVQLHAAHGFLINQFLSPAFNKRTDDYGGTLANRARFLLKVVQNVREAVGPEYPILVKLSSEDFLDGGLTREEAVQTSIMLEQASVDAIEFSGGTVNSPEKLIPPRPGLLKIPEQEVYYREAARLYKQGVAIPLILVGGIRSYGVAEELVQEGTADYISLSRPLISEPDLVKRWREGDRGPSICVSDNRCFGPGLEGKGIYCVTWEKKQGRSS